MSKESENTYVNHDLSDESIKMELNMQNIAFCINVFNICWWFLIIIISRVVVDHEIIKYCLRYHILTCDTYLLIINIKFEWNIVCCTWKNVPTANWASLVIKWGRYKAMNDKLKCNIDHPCEIKYFRNNSKWTSRKWIEREICYWISRFAKK